MNGKEPSQIIQKGGLYSEHLKLIALAAMLIDHTAIVLFPGISMAYLVMRFIGRISAPIFFFLAAEGYAHTRNFSKYLLRMGIFAAVSYLPFLLFINRGAFPLETSGWFHLNVLYTLCLGLAALWIWEHLNSGFWKWFLLIAIFLLSSVGDWGIFGVCYLLGFGIYRSSFRRQTIAFFVISAVLTVYFVGDTAVAVLSLVSSADQPLTSEMAFAMLASLVQLGVLLAFIPIALYNGKKCIHRLPFLSNRWFFYGFYPVHLFILGMLARFF